jgi:hypothetical protein
MENVMDSIGIGALAKRAALERIRGGLAQLVSVCPGHGLAKECPILKALGEESLE